MLLNIKGIGEVTKNKLAELGITSAENLIDFLPKQYIDLSKVTSIEEAIGGSFCLIDVCITRKQILSKNKKLQMFFAEGVCGENKIKLVWYNQIYVAKNFEINDVITIFGKVIIKGDKYEFSNPIYEKKSTETKFFGIQPVYRTRGIVPQKKLRDFALEVFKNIKIQSIIPKNLCEKYALMDLEQAYKNLHFPKELSIIKESKERVILEKIIKRIAGFRVVNIDKKLSNKVFLQNFDISLLYDKIPFLLNNSQKESIENLIKTIKNGSCCNSILCGDVGSGKTVVCLAVAYFVIMSGFQVGVMTPTEILARQHYNFFNGIFSQLGIRVDFLSSSVKGKQKEEVIAKVKNGSVDILIGTHSIISNSISYKNLGLVVIDEQHKFGVAQRTELISKGEYVNILTLSATPIPRSMQLVAYGDIDFVSIDRRFESNILTRIVKAEKRKSMFEYLAEEVDKGKQGYLVVPKIVDSEGVETDSVYKLFEEMKKYIAGDKIGILHGKLKNEDKQMVLEKFREQNINLLIATTVVEVGIDVPNASFIVVMNAEQFGLATLHQLRGRVGRNGEKAYCFLYSAKESIDNLRCLVKNNNGFEIAEEDFKSRGCGDILGLGQSGKGTLEGVTLKNLTLAKNLVDEIDLDTIKAELSQEIADFSLNKVSLT